MSTTVAVWLIYIATLSTSGGMVKYRFPMKDMDTCLAAVKAAQVRTPNGGDAESTVAIFCATKITPGEWKQRP